MSFAKIKKMSLLPIVWVVLIVVAAYVFLLQRNSELLFMSQLRSLFMSGGQFWTDCMAVPGGALRWAGCWFTQLFYDTPVGVSVLTALWVVLFLVLKKAYALSGAWSVLALIPVACLIASVGEVGYWVYYLKQPGYFFRETLGVLSVALVMLASRGSELNPIARNKYCALAYDTVVAVIAIAIYPLVGYYSPLALVCLLVRHAVARKWLSTAVTLALLAMPLVFVQAYSTLRLEDAYNVGFPMFENGSYTNLQLSYPFIVIIITLIALNFMQKRQAEGKMMLWTCGLANIAVVALCYLGITKMEYQDRNFKAEIQVYKAVDEQDWDKALDILRPLDGAVTRQLVIMKNIALMNKGTIGNEMFAYNDYGLKPNVSDSLQIHMVDVAGPLIYLHHGKTNFAYRWCIETMVEFGVDVNELKLMTQCAIVNGEKELAHKYIDMLSKTMHYKEWAEHYRKAADGEIAPEDMDELKKVVELREHMGSRLDSDQSLVEPFLINYFANTMNKDSKYLQEMTLVYSVIQKNIASFWQHFMLYAALHEGEEMPIHYQEVAYLYGMLEPQTMDVSHMPFDEKRIKERYASFSQTSQQLISMGVPTEAVGQRMASEFGDTFWWSYFFCRDMYSY